MNITICLRGYINPVKGVRMGKEQEKENLTEITLT